MEPQLLDALGQIREGIQIVGFDWRYLYVNAAVEAHGRRSRAELLGRTMMECYPGIETTPLFEHLTRCLHERVSLDLDNPFTFPDGTTGWFELHIEPVPQGLLIISFDVTERKALESQLRQSQKMEAIGRLAGGIAHDFNNLLTVMTAAGQFALESLSQEHPARADVADVLTAVDRATKLVAHLLAFSRRQAISPRVVDLNALLSSMQGLLARLVGEAIVLEAAFGADVWPARVDPAAFEQVVMNLAVNGRDAMPSGGRLTLETANMVLDSSHRMARGGVAAPGDYVVVAISDTGIGMDEQTRERLFEPFFTTKGPGAGTGLGLSTCFGIVKQAGGHIWVYSEPGHGSTFKIYLPRATGPVEPLRPPTPVVRRGGSETVLVIEDDRQVRAQTCRILREAGYRVFEAAGGPEAQSICASAEGEIHLLLTDVVMPGVNGREVAEAIRRLRPGIKVVYMSGYTENAIVHHGVVDAGVRLVQKPFTPSVLTREVRAVLDETDDDDQRRRERVRS